MFSLKRGRPWGVCRCDPNLKAVRIRNNNFDRSLHLQLSNALRYRQFLILLGGPIPIVSIPHNPFISISSSSSSFPRLKKLNNLHFFLASFNFISLLIDISVYISLFHMERERLGAILLCTLQNPNSPFHALIPLLFQLPQANL